MKRAALVTGASQGIGRGVATCLHDEGYLVVATGRTIRSASLPDGVHRITCDHADDQQTIAAAHRATETGCPLQIVVNCAWPGYERMVEGGDFTWTAPFWQQPMHRWQSMIDVGLRAAFVTNAAAVPAMIAEGRGLIVNLSYWAAQKHLGNTIYGIAKAATDKMSSDMAHELDPYNIAVVSLYPDLVRTERVQEAARTGHFSLEGSESPEFVGAVIAALARDDAIMKRSGAVAVVGDLGREYKLRDFDGGAPTPLTLDTA